MGDNWMGKAVSIRCYNSLGVFQGTIKNANHNKITITRAFRNGIPLRKQNMEITISATDIEKLELIPTQTTNNVIINKPKVQNGSNNTIATSATVDNISLTHHNDTNSVNKSPINDYMNDLKPSSSNININRNINHNSFQSFDHIDKCNLNGTDIKTFGTPVDDPTMDEDFDFEKNLALFDKEAIWQKINKTKFKKQKKKQQPKSYRHDENVLETKPMQTRQINVGNLKNNQEYVTDDGLVIPAIPLEVRECLQKIAELNGLIWLRQCDIFSRCTIEICLQLLGGARRLTQNNQHQWPIVCVVCDMPTYESISELGLSIARQLSTQGLKTIVYNSKLNSVNNSGDVKMNSSNNYELNLYNATGNQLTSNISKLPFCDLVVLAIKSPNLSKETIKWINENRSPVIAVDPPADGINNINIKCSIIPILPINNINISSLGKLYLCNLGIPDSYFSDVGIEYKSPFGHKFVIPIHPDNMK